MILRVCDQAALSGVLEDVIVATDDARISETVTAHGYTAVMTSPDHRSGTDRCLEALNIFSGSNGKQYDFVINIQGDEPFLPPEHIRQVAGLLLRDGAPIATLVKTITYRDDIFNPNVVKAVTANDGYALYFSRAPVPYLRDVDETQWASKQAHLRHIGIYGFRVEVLKAVCHLPESHLEKSESLEQLRWLESGFRIKTGITELHSLSIDTPGDLLKITNTG
jgi:3-deoxy-manno-octulosonate cytidylyltransferase (CMP-KDO synthetase)